MKIIGTLATGIVLITLAARGLKDVDQAPKPAGSVQLAKAPEKIYSDNPNDSWNRIFYFLFSRRVTAQLSSEFPEASPFQKLPEPEFIHLEKSTRTFERNEIGDRAIDPLYPSFLRDDGIRTVLEGPAYANFKSALQDGLADTAAHDAMARAMMQSDLWSAYDIVFRYRHYQQQGQSELAQHRLEVLALLGQFVQKIALTPKEIRALADNYATARTKYPLPDLFGKSAWVEVRWFPDRLHDVSVDYRRVARVFLKPARTPKDMQEFLNDFRAGTNPAIDRLEGVALIVQPLLVDTHGEVQATNIVTDVQIRMFKNEPAQEAVGKTQIGVYEVSRKLLRDSTSGFLSQVGEGSATYLPAAGNDYGFASPSLISRGTPLVVKEKTRCTMCHGEDLTSLMTFAVNQPNKEGPPVRQLNAAAQEAAEFVMSKKIQREDWKSLRRYFAK